MRSGPASSVNPLSGQFLGFEQPQRPGPGRRAFARVPFAGLDAPPGVLGTVIGVRGEAAHRFVAEARAQPLDEPRPVFGFAGRDRRTARRSRRAAARSRPPRAEVASTGSARITFPSRSRRICARRAASRVRRRQADLDIGVSDLARASALRRKPRMPACRAASKPSSCDQQPARAEQQRLRHASPRPAARVLRQSAAAARRTRAARAARRAPGRGRRARVRAAALRRALRAAARSSSPTVVTPMLRKNSTSKPRDLDRQRLERFAFAARKPQRRARRRRGRRARIEAQRVESRRKAFAPRWLEAAEQAQAALHFQQQLLRRLERDPRRELAGPGGDRRERVRRQARESGARPRAWTGLFTAGAAARRQARRGA